MRPDVRMCKDTYSECVTVKSWDCRFSREPIYNKSWDLHARHNLNSTSSAKKLRFTLDVIAGNNSERAASDLICETGGRRWRRLILAHLQGDIRTDF